VRLLDETAILACAAYVDLNPIRAAIAETLEDSDFTSAQKRIADLRAECLVGNDESSEEMAGSRPNFYSGQHLAPVNLQESGGKTGPDVHTDGSRCSDKGFLPMSTAEYLDLLDWTARQVRSGKRGSTPPSFAPLFERLGISADIWCKLVQDFGRLFSVVAGQPQRIDEHRSSRSSSSKSAPHRYRARREARDLFSPA
jgi:hypothetical protein